MLLVIELSLQYSLLSSLDKVHSPACLLPTHLSSLQVPSPHSPLSWQWQGNSDNPYSFLMSGILLKLSANLHAGKCSFLNATDMDQKL